MKRESPLHVWAARAILDLEAPAGGPGQGTTWRRPPAAALAVPRRRHPCRSRPPGRPFEAALGHVQRPERRRVASMNKRPSRGVREDSGILSGIFPASSISDAPPDSVRQTLEQISSSRSTFRFAHPTGTRCSARADARGSVHKKEECYIHETPWFAASAFRFAGPGRPFSGPGA